MRGEQVDPALHGAAASQAAPGDRIGEACRGFVLVHLAGFEDEERDRLAEVRVAELDEILGQAPALDQRSSPTFRSRARTAPTRRAGARRPGVTRSRRTRSRSFDQALRPRAASIARRVDHGHR